MVKTKAGTMPAKIRPAMLTLPLAASAKMIRLWLVGIKAPTKEAWVVTLTA
jgi:hypothetical protein